LKRSKESEVNLSPKFADLKIGSESLKSMVKRQAVEEPASTFLFLINSAYPSMRISFGDL
jgi:hypothetical protein